MTSIVLVVVAALLVVALITAGIWFWHSRLRRPSIRRRLPVRTATKISLLVPFHSDQGRRQENWDWLYKHWKTVLPDAEIIVQDNTETPFCKTAAVNAAFRRSRGDVIVILDADCYMDYRVILRCAEEIRESHKQGHPLWYIPYRRFYRLTDSATRCLIAGRPGAAMVFADPPVAEDYAHQNPPSSGHHWGAMVQIMHRDAFKAVGGMDERFKGWGGEDVAFMYAVETLYGGRRTYDAAVYHLWHPTIKGNWKHTRQWDGQPDAEMNDKLSERYLQARGDRKQMRELIEAT